MISNFLKTLKTCNCKTPLCNRNWEEAGATPGSPTDTPTEPADKTVKVDKEYLETKQLHVTV